MTGQTQASSKPGMPRGKVSKTKTVTVSYSQSKLTQLPITPKEISMGKRQAVKP